MMREMGQGQPGIERMWASWQGRRLHPNTMYNGHELLSVWSSYLVHLPFYMTHSFNSDDAYVELFQSHWKADVEYYRSEAMSSGDHRYGLGAGPTAQWCSGVGYEADKIHLSGPVGVNHCRMFSPYAVAGYMPAAPQLIEQQLLQLLADGETVLQVPDSENYILWRKSLLDKGWSSHVTLVDFSSELFGLSTKWLGVDFFRKNTDYFSGGEDNSVVV